MTMKNLPPLGPLPSFRAAAKHESFTRAAHELNLTHGAVSRSVKQLEDYFGFELFHRRNRRLFLTTEGRYFAEKVEKMLAGLERACEQMRISDTPRRISVSCEPSLSMRWLMPRLEKLHQDCPEIEVLLSTEGGPIDLSARGVDLAIRRSDFLWPDYYRPTTLVKERIGPVCSPGFWEKHAGQKLRILHTRTRPSAWTDWRKLSGNMPETLSEQFYDHFYFSLQAAVAGLGMAIGPEPLVMDDIDQGILVAPFGFISTATDYVALTLQHPANERDLNCFISWLKKKLSFIGTD
ncbi:LysR substrate-binding domain-containing protein [Maridesulfovibrio sp. FT414]|uniref:LysR substrate-binding domain-containing protein n=1 Tax=Maridesulfovibrio sp. FT414 TaxID=2979469 RepID=UPI003D80871A